MSFGKAGRFLTSEFKISFHCVSFYRTDFSFYLSVSLSSSTVDLMKATSYLLGSFDLGNWR